VPGYLEDRVLAKVDEELELLFIAVLVYRLV
jgi:hypothetical protein